MNQPTIKTAFKLIMAVIITFGLSLALQSILADYNNWQNPTCAPPRCNVPAPINVGSSSAPSTVTQGAWSNLNVAASSTQITTAGMGVAGMFAVNTNRLFVDGLPPYNVGIGTMGPSSLLHVKGGKIVSEGTNGSWGLAQFVNTSVGEATIVQAAGVTGGFGGVLTSSSNNYIWAYGPGSYGTTPDKFNIGSNGITGNVALSVSAPSGNVGIGTTNPTAKLEVANGNFKMTNGFMAYVKEGIGCPSGDTAVAYRTDVKTCDMGWCTPCTTGSHDWSTSNSSVETCIYRSNTSPDDCVYGSDLTCYATSYTLCNP